MSALAEFHSQNGRSYMDEQYQEAQLRFRGGQAGVEPAEAFRVLRWHL